MWQAIMDVQAFVLAIILLWAGGWEIFSRKAHEIAAQSALAVLLRRPKAAQVAHISIGTLEICIGISLFIPPLYLWEVGAVTGLATAFVGYLLVARYVAPDKPCACLGGHNAPISWRTLARAGLLLLISIVGWRAQTIAPMAIVTNLWLIILIIGEILLFVSLSPELQWAKNLRNLFIKPNPVKHAVLECATANVPWSQTIQQLEMSNIFAEMSGYLTSKEMDRWRDKCWRFFSYEAEYHGQYGTAIFAVPILYQPDKIHAVIVDDTDEQTLLTIDNHKNRHPSTVQGSITRQTV